MYEELGLSEEDWEKKLMSRGFILWIQNVLFLFAYFLGTKMRSRISKHLFIVSLFFKLFPRLVWIIGGFGGVVYLTYDSQTFC